MTVAKVKLINTKKSKYLYAIGDDSVVIDHAKESLKAGHYDYELSIDVGNLYGEAAAEECFDLSNNPMRYNDYISKYGKVRPLIVGDIVEVNGISYICCTLGWSIL